MKRKVYTYITHNGRLLLFRHTDFPEAGVQVPGGTVADGEDTAVAALREAWEETGLAGLELVAKLGEDTFHLGRYGRDETQHRTFYHLRCTQPPPQTWRHAETDASDGTPGPIWFDLYWADLPLDEPDFVEEFGVFLDRLMNED